jgi:hypothetical protein
VGTAWAENGAQRRVIAAETVAQMRFESDFRQSFPMKETTIDRLDAAADIGIGIGIGIGFVFVFVWGL